MILAISEAELQSISVFMEELVLGVESYLRQALPDGLQWLVRWLVKTVEYLVGPFGDSTGRFHWVGIVAALLITGVVYLATAQAAPRSLGCFLRFAFPAAAWGSKSLWVDFKIGFVNHIYMGAAVNLTWRINTALFTAWTSAALTGVFGPHPDKAAWGPGAILAMAVVMSLASDFGYFLFHWASHRIPPLWALHKLHHSAEVMTPLTTARVHPLERAVLGPIRAVIIGAIMGPVLYLYDGAAPAATVFGLGLMGAVFQALGHVLHHSHVWVYYGPIVGRIIVSPAQHQIHHSSLPQHLDRNFAEHWSIFDALFGTLYLPKGRETLKLGLTGYTEQPHTGLLTGYLLPVWEAMTASLAMARRILGQVAARLRPGRAVARRG